MKKIIALILFSIVICKKSHCQDTIFSIAWSPYAGYFFDLNDKDTANKYFNFDTTQVNNIWQLGVPQKLTFDSAYSSPLAFVTDTLNNYSNNNTSSILFTVSSDCNWFEINFMHRINTDTLIDGGTIEYSIDSGNTWINIRNANVSFSNNFYLPTSTIASNSNKAGFTGTSGWMYSWFIGQIISPVVQYRFTFTSDSNDTNKDGWIIDNISTLGYMVGNTELESNISIKLFPNPTSNLLSIEIENPTQFVSAAILEVGGKVLDVSTKPIIDLSKFENGVYFIKIISSSGVFLKRVIKN